MFYYLDTDKLNKIIYLLRCNIAEICNDDRFNNVYRMLSPVSTAS